MKDSPETTPELDALLLTTCDALGGRIDELLRLLTSISRQAANDGVRVVHYVLLQRAGQSPAGLSAGQFAHDVRFMRIPGRASLSRARNLLLGQAAQDGMMNRALWVAFPDDDAWYPRGLVRRITELFRDAPGAGLITCDYGSAPAAVGDMPEGGSFAVLGRSGDLVRTVSSNTLFVRAEVARRVGFFDERLGVGASINGGEDLDFALRAFARIAGETLISRATLVGHRDRQPWVRSTYFSGSLFALARSARSDRRLWWPFVRKLLVGGVLVLRGELPPRQLMTGIGCALKGFGNRAPFVTTTPARR